MTIKQFNKKNLLEFADTIYKQENGWIYYQPLCRSFIAGKLKGEIVHCILGELYEYFIGPIYLESNKGVCPIFNEVEISKALAKISTCKEKDYFALMNEINNLDCINDDVFDYRDGIKESGPVVEREEVLIERAKACATHCRKIAKKYLK